VVAIDGPAGAGKSTIAKRVAARLGFIYIDSGAMYRAVALWALRQKVDPGDMHRMEQLAIAAEIDLVPGRIRLNGEDVTDAIRTPEVSGGASKLAVIPGVRRALVAKQRAMGERSSVVMEGRDIGRWCSRMRRSKSIWTPTPASACGAGWGTCGPPEKRLPKARWRRR